MKEGGWEWEGKVEGRIEGVCGIYNSDSERQYGRVLSMHC